MKSQDLLLFYDLLRKVMDLQIENEHLRKKLKLDNEGYLGKILDYPRNFFDKVFHFKNIEIPGNHISIRDDRDISLLHTMPGFLIFPECNSNLPASTKLCRIIQKHLYNSVPVVRAPKRDNPFEKISQGMLKPHLVNGELVRSRYHLRMIQNETTIRQDFLEAILHFSENVAYVYEKSMCPSKFKKYESSQKGVGIFDAMSCVEMYTQKQAFQLMDIVGHHTCTFNRYLTDENVFPLKTLKSIQKCMTHLLAITNVFFNSETTTSMYAYINATDDIPFPRVMTSGKVDVIFFEGYFAEGKSTFCKNQIEEYEGFIRGVPTFSQESFLEIQWSPEESRIVNKFLNASAIIMQVFKIYNVFRCHNLDCIHIDRSVFSRFYFSHFRHIQDHTLKVEQIDFAEVVRLFFGPLVLIQDMIQCNFKSRINVKFTTQFVVNTMKDNAHGKVPITNWRFDQQREFERKFLGDRENPDIEKEKSFRRAVYENIFYELPSLFNFLVHGSIKPTGIENNVMSLGVDFDNHIKAYITAAEEIEIISDRVSPPAFKSFFDRIYPRNLFFV